LARHLRSSIEVDSIDHAHYDRLYRDLRVLEQRSRRVALLNDEHLLAHADTDHVERNNLGPLFSIIEIQSTNEQKLLVSEMLVAVCGHHVANDASEIHSRMG
jgi:hypothetical protein